MPWFVLVTKTTCSGIGIHNLAFGLKKTFWLPLTQLEMTHSLLKKTQSCHH